MQRSSSVVVAAGDTSGPLFAGEKSPQSLCVVRVGSSHTQKTRHEGVIQFHQFGRGRKLQGGGQLTQEALQHRKGV